MAEEVFLSFITEEREIAELVKALIETATRMSVFMASELSIPGGKDWLQRIESALQGCKVAVLMLSKASAKQPWVNFEAGAAWLAKRDIIPVCYGGQSNSLPDPYRSLRFQAIQLEDAHGPNNLLNALRSAVPHPVGVRKSLTEHELQLTRKILKALKRKLASHNTRIAKPKQKSRPSSTDDLVAALEAGRKRVIDSVEAEKQLAEDEQSVLRFFPNPSHGHFGSSLSSISRKTNLSLERTQQVLSRLEGKGLAHHQGENWYLGRPGPI